MKGLLIKDIKLMGSQMKLFAAIMILWGIFMSINFSVHFFIGYVAILCSFLTMSSLNFDEFENGMIYIFTLPVLKKDYIREKYVFGLLITTVPTFLAVALSWTMYAVRGMEADPMEYLISIVGSLAVGYLLLAFELPLQIKFGQQKSRIVSLVSIGAMGASMGVFAVFFEEHDGSAVLSAVMRLGNTALALLTVLIVVALLWGSYQISCRIMDKKEF